MYMYNTTQTQHIRPQRASVDFIPPLPLHYTTIPAHQHTSTHTPPAYYIPLIIIGFLKNRFVILRHNGISSSSQPLPGGGPQGTILGMFIFLILIILMVLRLLNCK